MTFHKISSVIINKDKIKDVSQLKILDIIDDVITKYNIKSGDNFNFFLTLGKNKFMVEIEHNSDNKDFFELYVSGFVIGAMATGANVFLNDETLEE